MLITIDDKAFGGCIIESEAIHQLKVVGPAEASMGVLQWIHDKGGRVTRLGPYTDCDMFPSVDPSRCLITADIPNPVADVER